jgi:hypothetical protein
MIRSQKRNSFRILIRITKAVLLMTAVQNIVQCYWNHVATAANYILPQFSYLHFTAYASKRVSYISMHLFLVLCGNTCISTISTKLHDANTNMDREPDLPRRKFRANSPSYQAAVQDQGSNTRWHSLWDLLLLYAGKIFHICRTCCCARSHVVVF